MQQTERAFVRALAEDLSAVAAPQIDATETALTAEGDACLILLIPHRALGGISIVVWLWRDRAEITWACVAGLDCCHDSLDQGVAVGQFRLDRVDPDFGPVRRCVSAQVRAPLTIQGFPNGRSTVLVRDHRGTRREVGRFGPSEWRGGLFRRAEPVWEATTSLADPVQPPIAMPSGVDDWFGSDGPNGA